MPNDDVVSWGRVLRARHNLARPQWRDELPALIAEGSAADRKLLAIGSRRSYGDSGLNPDGVVIDMMGLDRVIAFDPATRRLRAEAGISFDALLKVQSLVLARLLLAGDAGDAVCVRWAARSPTTSTARTTTVLGRLGAWVRRLGLLRSDGSAMELGPDDETGLFAATIRWLLGLTGVIAWVEIEVMPIASAMMEVETIPFGGLDDFFAIAAESDEAFDYTVAWIDCLATEQGALGRGIFSRGHAIGVHRAARARRRKARRAAGLPARPARLGASNWAGTVKAFNALYYANGRRRAGRATMPHEPFFYPLDAIGGWNRMYGKRGMYQYQSVVPPEAARDATKAVLGTISGAGQGSFLAVLKTFGDRLSPGMLSFPFPGTTLALDFPNRGTSTLSLMERLDAIVREAGGRLYPAKDGRIPAPAMFPRRLLRTGKTAHRYVDPGFSSHFWRRVACA